jgi:hypothetical protein
VDHRDVTRREFARQVGEFERPDSFFGDRQVLEWIAAHVPVGSDDVVLDVAGGAGHVGRHLAVQAAFAVVVDLTREMLQAGVERRLAQHGVRARATPRRSPSPTGSSTWSSAASRSTTSTSRHGPPPRWRASPGPAARWR